MLDWIPVLLELQNLDIYIATQENALNEHPAILSEIRKQFTELKAQVAAASKALTDAELEVKSKQGMIAELKAKKEEFQKKSGLIKNNNEYKAALTQMALCDSNVSALETEVLEGMDKVEQAKAAKAAILATYATEEQKARAILKTIDDEKKSIQAAIDQEKERRASLASLVPADMYARYERVRTSPRNNKLRPILVSTKDGCCGRCSVALPPNLLLNVRKEQIMFCSSCGAILYYEQ